MEIKACLGNFISGNFRGKKPFAQKFLWDFNRQSRLRPLSWSACATAFVWDNSASCERVFALLKNLFGDQQMSSLADYEQSSLMLNYNGRNVRVSGQGKRTQVACVSGSVRAPKGSAGPETCCDCIVEK